MGSQRVGHDWATFTFTPTLQADSLPSEPPGKLMFIYYIYSMYMVLLQHPFPIVVFRVSLTILSLLLVFPYKLINSTKIADFSFQLFWGVIYITLNVRSMITLSFFLLVNNNLRMEMNILTLMTTNFKNFWFKVSIFLLYENTFLVSFEINLCFFSLNQSCISEVNSN